MQNFSKTSHDIDLKGSVVGRDNAGRVRAVSRPTARGSSCFCGTRVCRTTSSADDKRMKSPIRSNASWISVWSSGPGIAASSRHKPQRPLNALLTSHANLDVLESSETCLRIHRLAFVEEGT